MHGSAEAGTLPSRHDAEPAQVARAARASATVGRFMPSVNAGAVRRERLRCRDVIRRTVPVYLPVWVYRDLRTRTICAVAHCATTFFSAEAAAREQRRLRCDLLDLAADRACGRVDVGTT